MKNLLLPTLIALSFPAAAAQPDVLPVKQISLELARHRHGRSRSLPWAGI